MAKAEYVTNMDVPARVGTSFINIKERLVEEARGFNLLSNRSGGYEPGGSVRANTFFEM